MKIYEYIFDGNEISLIEHDAKETKETSDTITLKDGGYLKLNFKTRFNKSILDRVNPMCGNKYLITREKNLAKAKEMFIADFYESIEQQKKEIALCENGIARLEKIDA